MLGGGDDILIYRDSKFKLFSDEKYDFEIYVNEKVNDFFVKGRLFDKGSIIKYIEV